MRIENITRYTFIGDNAETHAKIKREKAKAIHGDLVSDLIYYPQGRVGFEIIIVTY